MRREAISNIEASSASTNKCAPYLAMVDLLIGLRQTNEALAYAERAKSQALLDLLARSGVTIDKGLTAQQRDQEAALKGELISVATQIYREKQRNQPDQGRLDGLEKLRHQKQTEFGQFQTRLNTSNPYLRVLRGEQKPLRPEESSRLLSDASAVLLDYVVTDSNTYLFVISRAPGSAAPRVEAYGLNAARSVLADKVGRFRLALENKDEAANALGQELFAALINPVKEKLEGKSSIIIIPDDSLWYLPFQALAANESRFLIEDFDISYAPSLTALDEMKKLRARNSVAGKPRLSLLAAGDPVLSEEAKTRIILFESGRNLSPRPEEQKQLKEFGAIYGATQSRILVQTEAKEKTAKTETGKFRFLHFTATGTINDAAPMRSYIAFTKEEQADNEDGLVEAAEILSLDLKADLAIMSGSKVAGAQANSGAGMLGLSWAFFVGGCPDMLVSQWQTDSPVSTELMISFHKRLKGEIGTARSEAISKTWRSSILELIKKPETRNPYNWAGFSLVGAQK
jgi:CHAT domain-containing protein